MATPIRQIQTSDNVVHDIQGVEYISGTQSSATNMWTGISKVDALYDGMMINYYLPVAGATNTNTHTGQTTCTTLELFDKDGNSLGVHPVYRNANTTITTHYASLSVLPIVYDEKASGTQGTLKYTGAWKVADYDANTTTTVQQSPSSTNSYFPVIHKLATTTAKITTSVAFSTKFKVNASNGSLMLNTTQLNPASSAATLTFPSGEGTLALTSDIPSSYDWSNIDNKPASYTPTAHTHDYSKVSATRAFSTGTALATITIDGTSTTINVPNASSSTAGITKVGASGGAAAFSHTHSASDVDLSAYAPLASPALTGTPTAPTPSSTAGNTTVVNKGYVTDAITTAIAGVIQFDYQVTPTLPASGSKGTIYLVAHTHGTKDIYDEYIWVNSDWEKIGNTDIDLSGYKTTQTEVTGTVTSSGTATQFITNITQDTNGVITRTAGTLPTASSSTAGITKVGASGGAAAYSHNHSWSNITNPPASYTPTAHTHSTSDITGIGDYANQNAFSNIKVGSTTVVADAVSDTVTFEGGSSLTITPDATNDKITFGINWPTSYTPSSHTHSWANITNPPASYTPTAHTHDYSKVSVTAATTSGTSVGTVTVNNNGTATTTTLKVDLSGYISGSDVPTYESDPIFSASAAAGITSSDISNWNGKSVVTASSNSANSGVTIGTITINGSTTTFKAPVLPTAADFTSTYDSRYKRVQNAVTGNPTVSGTTDTFITNVTQDAQGVLTRTASKIAWPSSFTPSAHSHTVTVGSTAFVKSYPGASSYIYPAADVTAVTGITYSTTTVYGTGTTSVVATVSGTTFSITVDGTVLKIGSTIGVASVTSTNATVSNGTSRTVVSSASASGSSSVRGTSISVLTGLGTAVTANAVTSVTVNNN